MSLGNALSLDSHQVDSRLCAYGQANAAVDVPVPEGADGAALQVQQFHLGLTLEVYADGVVCEEETGSACDWAGECGGRGFNGRQASCGEVRHVAGDQETVEQFQGLVEIVFITEVDGFGPIFVKFGLVERLRRYCCGPLQVAPKSE